MSREEGEQDRAAPTSEMNIDCLHLMIINPVNLLIRVIHCLNQNFQNLRINRIKTL